MHQKTRVQIASLTTAFILLLMNTAFGARAHNMGVGTTTCGDIRITYSPTVLWPPNHKLQPIHIQATDDDNDGDSFSITVDDISDNQSDQPGGGCGAPTAAQGPDSTGVGTTAAATDPGTVSASVELRSERCGAEGDRVYDIHITCTDEGSSSATDAFVTVPHDQGHGH